MKKGGLNFKLPLLLLLLLLVSACNTNNQGLQGQQQNITYQEGTSAPQPLSKPQPEKKETNHFPREQAVEQELNIAVNHDFTEMIHAYQLNGKTYVPIKPLLEILGFHITQHENQNLSAGFTDELIRIESTGREAQVEEKRLLFQEPVLKSDSDMFATIHTVQQLFGDLYQVHASDHTIHFHASNHHFGFPQEPNPGDIQVEEAVPALSGAKADQIINTAKKYIGTPYTFGAAPGQTSTFDCASFVQYVYAKHGIKLPRVSRQQAQLGTPISSNNLQKGDLLFFYWPGRFASNNIVGHVAIYLGNGYMIQATPSRGVHIVNFSQSSYWKTTYLGAKRLSGA